MADYVTEGAAPEDILYVASFMREADRDEVQAAGSEGPLSSLQKGAKLSPLLWTWWTDDKPAAIFGVAHISEGVGAPWLLGTDAITANGGAFIRQSRVYIPRMLSAYPKLFNFVDARNKRAVRWLKAMGFKLADPIPAGPLGLLFHPFEMSHV